MDSYPKDVKSKTKPPLTIGDFEVRIWYIGQNILGI